MGMPPHYLVLVDEVAFYSRHNSFSRIYSLLELATRINTRFKLDISLGDFYDILIFSMYS